MSDGVDTNSATWKAVAECARQRRQAAVENLIGGYNKDRDDQFRGVIRAMDDILELGEQKARSEE